jgi:hypothetical protein
VVNISEDLVVDDIPVDPAVDPDIVPPSPPSAERRVVGELIESDESEPDAPPPVTELTDQERRDFASLITCGRRSKTITVMGHPVVIQTLNTADEMRIGLFTKPYLDSQLGFQRAYQVAVCAAGIREVQGKPLFSSLRETTSEDEIFDRSVTAVQEFYPIVITQVYQAIMDLEREFAELAIKLGKLSG